MRGQQLYRELDSLSEITWLIAGEKFLNLELYPKERKEEKLNGDSNS